MRLRRRLVILMVVLGAAGIAASGAVGVFLLRGYSLSRVDSQLEGFASRRQPSDTTGTPSSSAATPAAGASRDCTPVSFRPRGILFELYNPDGSPQCAPASQDDPGGGPDLTTVELTRVSTAPFTVSGRLGGHQYRVTVRPGPGGSIAVLAIDLAGATATWHDEAAVAALVGAAVVALLAIVGAVLVRRELEPLEQVTAAADSIAAGDLSHRVETQPGDSEVGRLSAAFNTMIDAIEASFEARQQTEARLRQFVADASHELRTPISSIRGFAELFKSGGIDNSPDLAVALRRIEQESVRMSKLVDDLAVLSRFDERPVIEAAPVDLSQLVRDAGHDLEVVDRERIVTIDVVDDVVVLGDEHALRQVLANLTSNARSHTPTGSPVELGVRVDGPEVVVEVIDHGPGVEPQRSEAVFDRFVRLDPSRTRGSGGSGLGLSIVRTIVAAHHGTAAVVGTPGGGATFRVRLPRIL